MRIGFFTDSYLPRLDGISISVETFRKQLELLGHEVYVFCPDRPEAFIEPSPRIYRFKSKPAGLYEGYRNTFPFARKHFKAIAELKLDVVHIHTPLQVGMLGYYVGSKGGLPLVITCHSDPGLFKDYKWGRPLVTMALGGTMLFIPRNTNKGPIVNPLSFEATLKAYLNRFDLIISPSKKIQTSLRQLGVQVRTEIVPTGFDGDLLPIGTATLPPSSRASATDRMVFISTSRLVKEKRIDFLLRAFALAIRGHSNYVYEIVNDGPARPALVRLAAKLGISDQVQFIGKLERPELIETLKGADILISASLRETQGLVFNEAAALGLPAIALENDINPVLQDGRSALVPENTIQDYAHAMQELAGDAGKRLRFGESAQKLADEYSASAQSLQLAKLYRELLDHSAQ